MHPIRELTQPGDPMLRIKLPKVLHQAILTSAKKNKRRPQDELIKRITATLKADAEFQEIQNKLLLQLTTTQENAK